MGEPHGWERLPRDMEQWAEFGQLGSSLGRVCLVYSSPSSQNVVSPDNKGEKSLSYELYLNYSVGNPCILRRGVVTTK